MILEILIYKNATVAMKDRKFSHHKMQIES